MSWFVTKTGQQGSVNRVQDAQQMTMQTLETSPEFKLNKQWLLPDNSFLNLYERIIPFVEVLPLKTSIPKIELERVLIPTQAPPGLPVPVTYQWRGSLRDLQQGIVILNWKLTPPNPKGLSFWIHDHGIGTGQLYGDAPDKSYQVTETNGDVSSG
ncbi:MAG: hypothetical protein RSE13_20550 [Planktothrix sp. GU0601_MAG3]|nr:MAG: hypothetical protein RSE13_20550 [Planktothrix sp. GU0601_MAG3]